ncbi:MAG TPA: serine/threonine-protein kinase, partial [Pyrinomonadaceae bacterium]|nr:serine/threonine-protein kinase [Pyrinomonadaceae bacterium]
MAFCHHCGTKTAENEVACSQCGTSLEALPIGDEGNVLPFEAPVSEPGAVATGFREPAAAAAAVAEETPVREVLPEETPIAETSHADSLEAETPELAASDVHSDDSPIITDGFEDKPEAADAVDIVPAANVSETSHTMGNGTDGKRAGLKTLAEGTVLNNRYEIVRKIGGGGMGAVYLALDRNLGDVTRAVKEMVQSNIEEEQQQKAIEDFRRESMILSTLDHPSIPTIYDYFFDETEGRFYLVMKYISGGDLSTRLRSAPGGRIDETTVTEWALQVADVLAYLHNLPQTIVYRDLKPSNVMLDGTTGRTMLIDFGIARSIN